MKKTKAIIISVSVLLICAVCFNMAGCASSIKADLMAGVKANNVLPLKNLDSESVAITDFAVRIFKASAEKEENTLISPLSVLYALAMTANGAKGETRAQMEAVLGMSVEELNVYLYSYMDSLPQSEKSKLMLANSIWFADYDRFTVNEDFLQTNADYYEADIYKASFDRSTVRDINNWVKEKTDGMITDILDDIPVDAIMYLVNALAFEAEWTDIYEKAQVRDGIFTEADGSREEVKLMYSNEGVYLEDENAIGFIKYYKGRDYAFAALLPNENVSLEEYVASLDGESLNGILANAQYATVNTAIPKFETEYDVEMSDILKRMGMTDAFDGNAADFSGIGASEAGNIYISRVLHKTYISVGEKGTRAGAATVVEMKDSGVAEITDPKQVYLDRPFLYMLIDCDTNIPFFIGTVNEID